MGRWAVYDERGGVGLGFVDAPDRNSAEAIAVGKFELATFGIVYVKSIPDTPKNITINPAMIRKYDAVVPDTKVDEEKDDIFTAGQDGDVDWRDGPRDDGSYESDDILPD